MQLSIEGVSERLVYSIFAVIGVNALVVAAAVSGHDHPRALVGAALTYAAYRFVYKTLARNAAAACNAAAGLAIVHAVIAYNSIHLHAYLLLEVVIVALLAGVVRDLRDTD